MSAAPFTLGCYCGFRASFRDDFSSAHLLATINTHRDSCPEARKGGRLVFTKTDSIDAMVGPSPAAPAVTP